MNKSWRSVILILAVGGCWAVGWAAGDLHWQTSWATAQAAAQKSGKFILAYIYQHQQPACVEMEKTTYPDENVIAALGPFELLALNGDASSSRAFCEHYKVGTRFNTTEGRGRDSFGAVPAYLFLDYHGKEYFRTYGFYPPAAFVQMLGQVSQLIQYRCTLDREPSNGRAHADLGHVYLLLGRPEAAQPLLKQAIQLDTDNAAGARADAELDLIILGIPDDPLLGFRQLVAHQFNYPETKRGLEIKYYMAVAQLAAGREDQAEKILLDFAAIPPFLPDDHNMPGVRYGTLVECEGRQVGFWDTDDRAKIEENLRKLDVNPAQCKFIRKPINPDYRNQWTVLADLLLKQMRQQQAGGQ